MSIEIKGRDGNKLTLQVTVDISGSMLEAEEKIQAVCNEIGSLSTEKALERFDTDGSAVVIGKKKIHRKKEGE